MPRLNLEKIRGAWISEAKRLEFNTRTARVDGIPPEHEVKHFNVCEGCGQAVDMRLLGDVLYHDQIEHSPLLVN